MRQTRSIMGMPVQLEIVDAGATDASYEMVFDYFRTVDEQFSPYKETSEVARINRGELIEGEYSEEMRKVLALCAETTRATNGYFDIRNFDNRIDPSGLVKGWAINNAAALLRSAGLSNFYVEIAGDIQTSGLNDEGNEWSIGIRNPFVEGEIVKVVYPQGKGIATSGTYIRGSHIYNPFLPDDQTSEYVSLTVIGPNVYEADRFATAAFVMGEKGIHFLEGLSGFEAYAIDRNGQAVMTSGFEEYTLKTKPDFKVSP
jgi:thiamine biosynthesis lipoprotein